LRQINLVAAAISKCSENMSGLLPCVRQPGSASGPMSTRITAHFGRFSYRIAHFGRFTALSNGTRACFPLVLWVRDGIASCEPISH
jgi:hypothetical protein